MTTTEPTSVNDIFRNSNRISTGSRVLDDLLTGGLSTNSMTDIYGAAGTGKTQLAFQVALTISANVIKLDSRSSTPMVAFVDCNGSFRPERIVEMAKYRDLGHSSEEILRIIYSIRARNTKEQMRSCDQVYSEDRFQGCRLLVVDDLTTNFLSDSDNSKLGIIERQSALALYARKLAFIANKKAIPVLVTNSFIYRDEDTESETTGEIISEYSLFRVRFKKKGRERVAQVEQPRIRKNYAKFVIETQGIP